MEKLKVNDETSNYNSKIENEKERFKQEIMKYNTKDEKLLYIKQQKQRYALLKENSKFSYGITIIVSIIMLISIILMLEKSKQNIFMTSLIFTLIVIDICICIILMLNLKNVSIGYTITLFALDELEYRVSGTLGASEIEILQLKEVMKNMSNDILRTKDEVKEGYAMVDQRLTEVKNKLF